MAVCPETTALCREAFAAESIELAVRVLESYDGEQAERVHQSAVRLSDGRLNRLPHWLRCAERDIDALLWYAGEQQSPEDSPEKQAMAADFLGGLMDKELINRPQRPS